MNAHILLIVLGIILLLLGVSLLVIGATVEKHPQTFEKKYLADKSKDYIYGGVLTALGVILLGWGLAIHTGAAQPLY